MTWLRDRLPSTIFFAVALLLSAYGGMVLLLGWGGTFSAAVITWACAQVLLIALCVHSFLDASRQDEAEWQVQQVAQLQRSILDSAGPMILATDLEGNLLIFNPAAERMLGYRNHEVLGQLNAHDLFPEGELERVGQLLVSRLDRSPAIDLESVSPELKHYVQYVTSFPVSRVRGFEILCRRKDATTFPAMVYLSAVRNTEGALTGLLAIATDLTATKRAEHALRESEERYRDLFENSQEMIATLSPRAKYLYVNPAWQTCFGKSAAAFESLISFEAAFPPEMQANAAGLFDRALRGERIDRANLRVQDSNGMYRELEASLSCRQDRGEPVSVRCIFRDVTAQYQRERRLAMQLAVSQVVGESTTSDEALPAMLESLGTNLGFDMAGLWFVSSDHHCRYLAGWYAPDRACTEFHRDSIGRVLQKGKDLPGQIWAAESPCWIEDLQDDSNFLRASSAKTDGLITGWGVPVRVGNQVIAVVEFFSRQKQREDTEMMATVETVCASIGQFMARSAQESRLEELNRQKESILNSVADGIFGTDSAGRIVFVNPAAASMLGAHAFDLIGRTVHSVVHEERKGREKCSDQCRTGRAFMVREGTSGQDVFYRRNGASFPVEFSVTPMVEHNVAVGSVLSFRDISQRYALDRMKDEFVSTVSHELRTPLTSIRGSLGLLSTGLLGEMGEKASNLLRIAVNNSDRLVRLINDILDLERMQSGRAPLTYRSCDLEDLARQAIDAMEEAAATIRERIAAAPRVAIVLGSGLGSFADRIEQPSVIAYTDIPHFPRPTVEGHSGRLVVGTIAEAPVAVMQGRVHAYEGYSPEEVTFPIRVLGRLGIRTLVVTNAAGGIRLDLRQGQLVLLSDHINFTGRNPVSGANDERLGPRFFDMTEAYSKRLRLLAHSAAELSEGVYLAVSGPSFETPAEINAFRTLGADLVGMSTVQEVIVARHMGIEVLGISCVTNMGAGILDQAINHHEVMETGARVQAQLTNLLTALLPALHRGN